MVVYPFSQTLVQFGSATIVQIFLCDYIFVSLDDKLLKLILYTKWFINTKSSEGIHQSFQFHLGFFLSKSHRVLYL